MGRERSNEQVNHMKKFFVYFFLSIVVATLTTSLYLFLPKYFETFDSKLRDQLFLWRGEIETTGNVVIVDIDEKSLEKVGQWPWGRDTIAELLVSLTNAGVVAIGFDMVFAESDRSSPKKIIKNL